MIILKKEDEFSAYGSGPGGTASWFNVPNTSIKLNHKPLKLNISFNFKLGGGYYNAGVKCMNIFEFYVHRDTDGYINIYNQKLKVLGKGNYRNSNWHSFNLDIVNDICIVKIDGQVQIQEKVTPINIDSNFQIRSHDDTTYIRNILVEFVPRRNFLIKQNSNYYAIKSNLYELGKSIDDTQLRQWYKKYSDNDINILIKNLSNREMPMTLDETTDIWKTDFELDANNIIDNIELIENDYEEINYKIIKYGSLNYRILDELNDEFEIMMLE